MTSLPAQVMAIEERGDQYQVIVQISSKYRARLILSHLERSNRSY